MNYEKTPHFLQPLYKWYTQNQRNLPWRETSDPYKIWISEIILQQTRVNQGISYYLRFIQKFPTVRDLALANEDEVLKLWQGLGYYARARNLHVAAKQIMEKHKGKFPGKYNEILSLKGVGPYTAAAIASIAFGLPYPTLDGNVYRVLARYFGISAPGYTEKGKNEFMKTAQGIMPAKNPGFHNQVLMEFGALQCIPLSPDCSSCPVFYSCYAAMHKKVAELPVQKPKVMQRPRYFCYYFIECGDDTWIEKRTGNDIWKNLYQFPLIETNKKLTKEKISLLQPEFLNDVNFSLKSISSVQKHILSHQIIYARLITIKTDNDCRLRENYTRVPKMNINNFAMPRLMMILMNKTGLSENFR